VSGRSRRTRRIAGELVRRAWEAAADVATITTGDARARRFAAFGENSSICFPPAALHGHDRIAIGSYTMVGPYSTLSAGEPFDPPSDRPSAGMPMLSIGDGCLLGRNATVIAHREVVIDDAVWMGDGVYISDQNHDWSDPDRPIGAQAKEPEPVRIGEGSWIGNGAMILAGAQVGRRVVVAAGAVVVGPVPDHAIVGGVPARTLGTTASP
jgi:acetyltransferase-like isoleucine patch superfamily enzyme